MCDEDKKSTPKPENKKQDTSIIEKYSANKTDEKKDKDTLDTLRQQLKEGK